MDINGKDVNNVVSDATTETVSATTDLQDVEAQLVQDDRFANEVHTFKESVEILSVEVVQSAPDEQHMEERSVADNGKIDEANMETELAPKECEDGFNEKESDRNSTNYANNEDKQEEMIEPQSEVKSATPDYIAPMGNCKDSLIIDGGNQECAKENQSSPSQSNTNTDSVPNEDTSNNDIIMEVVQSAPDEQHIEERSVADNGKIDEANMETELPPKEYEDGFNEKESDRNSTNYANNEDKQEEVIETQSEVKSATPDYIAPMGNCKDSLITDGENHECAKENQSSLSQSGTNTDSVPSEETANNDLMMENIVNSNMQQVSEEISKSAEDSNVETLGFVSTPIDNFGLIDAHNETVVTSLIQDENIETNTTINSTTGLSLLAQYGSDNDANDSDNDSVIEVPTSNHDYRNRVVEIDSDSDSSSSGSEVEYLNKIRKTIEKRMEVDDDEADEDDEDAENDKAQSGIRRKPKPKVKAKGELQLDDLPPIEDLQITVPEDECIVLGKIHSIVDQLVLVSAMPDSMLVDLETVLFLDKGQRVLGAVFDVLGQVADPLYCVRFNSNQQINEKNIQINDVVYLAPKTQYTQYIILSSIMRQKGSDASWEHDLEPPPRFLDYSDDEQQQQARRQMRNIDRPMEHDDPQKRQRRDSEEPQASTYNRPYNSQPRQRHPPPTRGSGPPNRGSYARPHQHYNPQYRNPQIPPNHNPSSWHSNYYPQAYAAMPPQQNIPYPGGYPRMPAQSYPQVPVYPMGMPYPPPPPPQHARPHMSHPAEHHQYMHNAFNMRPPTIPGHFDPSTLPPGSQ